MTANDRRLEEALGRHFAAAEAELLARAPAAPAADLVERVLAAHRRPRLARRRLVRLAAAAALLLLAAIAALAGRPGPASRGAEEPWMLPAIPAFLEIHSRAPDAAGALAFSHLDRLVPATRAGDGPAATRARGVDDGGNRQ